jgi:hypothetical protein
MVMTRHASTGHAALKWEHRLALIPPHEAILKVSSDTFPVWLTAISALCTALGLLHRKTLLDLSLPRNASQRDQIDVSAVDARDVSIGHVVPTNLIGTASSSSSDRGLPV